MIIRLLFWLFLSTMIKKSIVFLERLMKEFDVLNNLFETVYWFNSF